MKALMKIALDREISANIRNLGKAKKQPADAAGDEAAGSPKDRKRPNTARCRVF